MKILISEIEKKENKKDILNFSEIIEEFNNEKPVTAKLEVEVLDTTIILTGKIHAEVNLTCDMCLKDFTKVLDFNVKEAYTRYNLNEGYNAEYEVKSNNFTEDLNGSDEIDITDFIYQCVILHIPNKLVCDINCKGDEKLSEYLNTTKTDPRLEIFKNIKIEKDK